MTQLGQNELDRPHDEALQFARIVGRRIVDLAGNSRQTKAQKLRSLVGLQRRSEEHTSELQSLMRISYAVFCLKKKTIRQLNRTLHLIRPESHPRKTPLSTPAHNTTLYLHTNREHNTN